MDNFFKAGQATDDNMVHAHCMMHNYGHTHSFTICNGYCFSTAKVVARKHLDVMFLRTLPALLKYRSKHIVIYM